ncbi:enoyl-CoA hydratase [archaeon]|nr:enoyl-CoA hydratase [archaeon]|tara:strand:+ start:9316 stop:9732 length:417 start_codon:yes stop_codon:yes gene_type:complete
MEPVKFSELKEGMKGTYSKKITQEDVDAFIKICDDVNPIHVSEEFAAKTPLKTKIVHGILTSSLISNVVGTKIPGPGSIWLDQNLKFLKPVYINDEITATSEILAKLDRQQVMVRTTCTNQDGEIVIEGTGLHKMLNP